MTQLKITGKIWVVRMDKINSRMFSTDCTVYPGPFQSMQSHTTYMAPLNGFPTCKEMFFPTSE